MTDREPALFPLFLRLTGRLCTVVGGGEVAARKVGSLLRAGAKVRVVAPTLGAKLQALNDTADIEYLAREYRAGDLAGSLLAFAATDSQETNAAVCREAERSGVLINVADDLTQSDFAMPATVTRGPICIAISTKGTSPALARHLRERLETVVVEEDGELARLLGRLRSEVMSVVSSPSERRARWRRVIESDVPALLREGSAEQAEAEARAILGISGSSNRE